MDFICKTATFDQLKNECAVIFTFSHKLSPNALLADELCSGALAYAQKQGDISEEAGSTAWFYSPSPKTPRILLISLGKPPEKNKGLTADTRREIAAGLASALKGKTIKLMAIHLDNLVEAASELELVTHEVAKALKVQQYIYSATKPSAEKNHSSPIKITLCHADKALLSALKAGLKAGFAAGLGINKARELGDLPANICTPSYLAQHAKDLAKGQTKLSTKIIDEAEMKKLGMNSLLSVSHGSDEPAKLIIMEYKGKITKSPHVLVGKGITFDTGGISIKPGARMDEMKFDMCGAASVFGVITALMELQAPVHVIGVVAAAENMPSGRATKPGDVVTSMAGKTIEILNTDAEGRLVLCDTLTYVERFKPKSVVDIATLTGACIIALGKQATGLYANDQELADKLLAAGVVTHDRAWQMPLWDDYKKQLKSNFADLANIGGREAGSVTAACFLSCFTEKYRWAHLDIAGPAWNSGNDKGATGRPVSLLLHYLLNSAD